MVDIVLGKEAAKKLQQASLSNDIIYHRVVDMSEDILGQVAADIKTSPVKISLQVEESTDESKLLSTNNSCPVREKQGS